ncbi:FAD-binding domain-containing protein [Picosynechococcus sp. PCC 8807]|uniref:FAD-binding domain-containing protein n=1 Tax=Picosynechococcus sp. PCC 8807 TaxID=195248 RepID=UPI00081070EE|nr:FAD-binding domain-containing protein [Picosynechococcus sp. PCC 8807]ANV91676.1 deoxyribodipyrimidine photolyase [Picosynechococcus sp. PCC 8807]
MAELVLHWHRRDLRLQDNVALAEARQQSAKVVGIFCLDPAILEKEDVAPARVKYLLACLAELAENYQKAGSQLLIFQGNPLEVLPKVAESLKVHTVYWNLDVEPYAQQRDHQMAIALREVGAKVETFWDQLLHAPGKVFTQSKKPYSVYSPFWKNWSQKPKAVPVTALKDCQGLSDAEQKSAKDLGAIALPSLADLGFSWDKPFTVPVGEAASLEKLTRFTENFIEKYDGDRNFPAIDGTSCLSAALKFGAIGIRTVWQATETALKHCRSKEAEAGVTTWQQELAWREFYQHCLFFFPELAQGPYREEFKDFPWENDEQKFQAWCAGQTGYPIIDAAMRQLNETGWMHNRCRMIVASFLTKDLIIDWRWGEKYFMQTLVDGDLAANNGGWQWSASSGMDPKPLRIFNPYTQAQKFDPEADYIRHWLPELSSLDTQVLLTGQIPRLLCQQHDYPEPIVEHRVRQREFKRLYKLVKDKA